MMQKNVDMLVDPREKEAILKVLGFSDENPRIRIGFALNSNGHVRLFTFNGIADQTIDFSNFPDVFSHFNAVE
jgi:hypothetical protein